MIKSEENVPEASAGATCLVLQKKNNNILNTFPVFHPNKYKYIYNSRKQYRKEKRVPLSVCLVLLKTNSSVLSELSQSSGPTEQYLRWSVGGSGVKQEITAGLFRSDCVSWSVINIFTTAGGRLEPAQTFKSVQNYGVIDLETNPPSSKPGLGRYDILTQ